MLSKQENGGCGNHNVFVSVVDVNGNPLLGAVVSDDPWNNFRKVTGDKNEPFISANGTNYGTKLAEIDLYKNSTQLKVVEYPVGNPVTSEQTPIVSTNDWQIPIPWLVEGGYCGSESECIQKRAVDRTQTPDAPGNNTLCWGHYSYWVTFKATHPF